MPDPLPYIPFARPDVTDAEIDAVVACLRSDWLTTGPGTAAFETEFAAAIAPQANAVAVNSATAGLHLAFEALGVGDGDNVVVPVYTFTASAEVLHYLGAEPRFVDVEADTLNVSASQFDAAIDERTRAILPVHFAGLACDMPAILALARERNVYVVEDAAHALPTTGAGTMVGAMNSDATVYSFYATKTLTTGEGGMILTPRSEIADRCRLMRQHGVQRLPATPGGRAWKYDVAEAGYKYNPTDISSAMGRVQLRRLHQMTDRRTAIARRYNEAFAGLPLRLPAVAPQGDVHSWHLYEIRIGPDAAVDRDRFIDRMHQSGIGCSVHFVALHLQSYWRDLYHLTPEMFPNADEASRTAVSLPIFSAMTDGDVDRVIDAVAQIVLNG